MNRSKNKEYIGDSVYAEWTGYSVVLTTENGLPTDPSNTIVVEEHHVHAIYTFIQCCKQRRELERAEEERDG